MRSGRFREDLLARINLWTFHLPPLRDRREDIEPNLDYELDQFARVQGSKVTFNKEARLRFLDFATGAESAWSGNFRDLNAAVTRMATFAAGGRVAVEIVEAEIARLRAGWGRELAPDCGVDLDALLDESALSQIDPFDRAQLSEVIRVCRASRTLSDAGRKLFSVSRIKKGRPNDADRLRKYLARFGLGWSRVAAATTGTQEGGRAGRAHPT